MQNIRTYFVRPALPSSLRRLDELARNLWWCWNHAAVDLFQRLDRDLWETVEHNPLALLSRIGQAPLEAAARDEGFLAQLDTAYAAFRQYMEAPATWFARHTDTAPVGRPGALPAEKYPAQRIAYFSAEFGLSESVPIYSGGLGVLAGDHLKSASDLGLPLVGVTLLYHEAFHQYLNADGWQQEAHPQTDLSLLPVALQQDASGRPIVVTCELPGRPLYLHVWRLDVGRVPLILLDSNLPENTPEDRRITDRLYGGDLDMRIRQEIVLGIGGLRALEALGLTPQVCHMNEGHSAFLGLERVRTLMAARGLSFAEASELASAGNVFTTHTPVPAGNDRFGADMIDRYFSDWYGRLGISREEFLALGREDPTDHAESFCMTVLALKLASKANGVAKLHGEVSRQMWRRVYPGVPQQEVPIGSITNGVHQRSFISSDMRRVFDSYLGPRWVSEPDEPETWQRIDRVPPEELWRAHERGRERTIAFVRQRLVRQIERRGGSARERAEASEALDPKALTIGFARRFATYKRATLVMRDAERLARIVNDAQRPVQFIFAGKAHQRDEPGKELLRRLVNQASAPEFRHRIVFVEDYDMNVARHLVQGVDIWLNTPIRPLEASGTSGMKVVVNGGIHVSVLDGWWAEGYSRDVGWAIGQAEEYADRDRSEKLEAAALYHLLEAEIVPMFYKRTRDGLPRDWIDLMKASLRKLAPFFNTHRMVREYYEQAYRPANERMTLLAENDAQRARRLASFRQHVARAWNGVAVRQVSASSADVEVGQQIDLQAVVGLGGLTPNEVEVQLFHGPVDLRGELLDGQAIDMRSDGRDGDDYVFRARIEPAHSGRYGYTVRVVPRNEDLVTPFGFVPVRWA